MHGGSVSDPANHKLRPRIRIGWFVTHLTALVPSLVSPYFSQLQNKVSWILRNPACSRFSSMTKRRRIGFPINIPMSALSSCLTLTGHGKVNKRESMQPAQSRFHSMCLSSRFSNFTIHGLVPVGRVDACRCLSPLQVQPQSSRSHFRFLSSENGLYAPNELEKACCQVKKRLHRGRI